ncbi:MAG TPA: hypothetical protein VOB72_07475 [Candidatus Dormibacteraeota bacterium]|nr:hypothetical protein [Candidatus Dormibacteraeota bacterium]
MQMSTASLLRSLAALAAVPLLAAACGVANPFAPASANNNAEQMRLAWAQCMRQHGVNVPDPASGSGGVGINVQATPGAGGIDAAEQQVQAAMDACKQYRPNGGAGGPRNNQQLLDQAIKFSQCMRQHGVNMPDPQSAGGGGIRIAASPGAFDPTSDQFEQAQEACKQYQPRGATTGQAGGDGGPGGGPATGSKTGS